MSDPTTPGEDDVAPRSDSEELDQLVADGPAALAVLFSDYRERLERMVSFRLDPRVRGRIDPSDVLQDAYLQVSKRLDEYLAAPTVSFYVWVRQQTWQVMIDLQRGHFRARRDPKREIQLRGGSDSQCTSYSIARCLVDSIQSPSQIVSQSEELAGVKQALDSMNQLDREVLALRHFELLGNQEVAEVLGISPTAASNRYVRAASRLGEIVAELNPSRSTSGASDE